ncbi:MAG: nucleoside hydrolase [Leptolyngbyaceae cyanobacterium]
MTAKPLIIDCDPGADDAIALLLALAFPEKLNLLGITTVAGNVPLALTQRNARFICDLAGKRNIPIYAGCPRPLVRSLQTAEQVHGKTGLDGLAVSEPTLPLQPQHGVEFLIQTLLQATAPITIATLGPLTNLAVALVQQPKIGPRIQDIVIMGGAVTHGNVTPSAEFNFYTDPHAAHVVLTSGLPITVFSLDVTHQVIATPDRIQAIRTLAAPLGEAVASLLLHYGRYDQQRHGISGSYLHDPCVIAYLLQPELITSYAAHVVMEIASELTMGRLVVDVWNVTQAPPNAKVVHTIDPDGFFQLLLQGLSRLPTPDLKG